MVQDVSVVEVASRSNPVELPRPVVPFPSVRFGDSALTLAAQTAFRPRRATIGVMKHTLTDVVLDPARAMLATLDGRLIRETRYLVSDEDYTSYAVLPGQLHEVEEKRAIVIGFNRAWRNHYHWMAQSLPAIHHACLPHPAGKVLAVPPLSTMQQESLALLGLDDVDRLLFVPGAKYRLSTAVHMAFLTGAGAYEVSKATAFTFDRLKAGAAPPSRGRRRLYVARSDTTRRQVRNEAELGALLRTRGFDLVCPGDHSLREQIALFDSASIVVGVHGAGLTNLGFCRPGTPVLEMMPDGYLNPCMAMLAQAQGLEYGLELYRTDLADDPHDAQGEIDLDALRRRVDAMVGHVAPVFCTAPDAQWPFRLPALQGMGRTPVVASAAAPDIAVLGDPGQTGWARAIIAAFTAARLNSGALSGPVRIMPGRTARALRIFLNSLTQRFPVPRYLGLGSQGGASLSAVIQGLTVRVTLVDTDDAEALCRLAEPFLTDAVDLRVVPDDPAVWGTHNIVMLNGPHTAGALREIIPRIAPALDRDHLLVVEDWNLPDIRRDVLDALAGLELLVNLAIEVRTSADDTPALPGEPVDHWGNGFLVAFVTDPAKPA